MSEKKNPWDKSGQWPEEMNALKAIIDKTELVEMTKWGGPVYTIDKKNVIGIGGFKSYVAIWFWNGVFLKDSAKKLVNANEGVTKGLRQWRFASKSEIDNDEALILHYINEAIANERAGLAIKPKKKETVISAFFQSALDSDAEFKNGFEKLTPFKQREYLEYIDTAKQEKTKATRLEKITPMVKSGIGLNDKYRQ
ncbi:YdeI/OmpD-associated family protein [Flavobacterium sp. MAH-1]|uniref:YdeI/OmpD-associated family protein n=2 Tax=Flavobacterium agri TaxID=2743471 RepID=A0A7Y8Y4D6_9FLAO|nr:YdeI/OmpD-associated family protein [Flavobacterium agri]NYA72404.1 YdeI/OmpD-associated family protein [Flavobacterium agri]